MNKLVVEGLGKLFQLGASDEDGGFQVFRKLGQWVRRRPAAAADKDAPRDFWALKDVSFTVAPGTVLGVIGANGAGKTTLLKILARVITPTEGRVAGSGRVVSLLELGAGFDPDLSARDNIFLNAAMLGIPRHDVVRRFDHILEFAEVGKFVDTPLKHYSSGMYLRLAFSVAINMEPSILLADEILAVGDLSFQERCLERVKQEAEQRGLTVLFVSHDMDAIVRICNQTLWLNGGKVVGLGDSEEIVTEYQTSAWAQGTHGGDRGRHANNLAAIRDVRVVTADGRAVRGLRTDEKVSVRMRFELLHNHVHARAAFDLRVRNQLVFRAAESELRYFRSRGIWEAIMRLPSNFFSETTYTVIPSLTVAKEEGGRQTTLVTPDALSFIVYAPEGTPSQKQRDSRTSGLISPQFRWMFHRLGSPSEDKEDKEDDVVNA
jgi:lipopolysaccharide transport system ATP-binding protein